MLSLATAPTLEPLTVAEARHQLRMGDSAGEPAPTAPTLALASPAAAGNCDAGAWRLGFTFVTADGETELGPLSAAVTVANPAVNGQITVTAVAIGGSAVTARKAYALAPGESVAKYAGQITNNTATTWTLNIAASSLGVQAPSVNTTVDPELERLITAVRERCELATGRALISQVWDLVLDGFPSEGWLEIPKPPLVSITHVKYRDTQGTLQTWAASNYVVDAPSGPRCPRGRLSLAYGVTWPSTYGQAGDVTVRFSCGYGAAASSVPLLLNTAMCLDLSRLYGDRDGEAELPLGVRAIYWSYRAPATRRAA